MQAWEDRANAEVMAAGPQKSLALRDSLPEFLGLLVSALSTTIDRTQVRIKWDRDENTRVGQKHGRERAGMLHYTMDQLIFEYHILRQVICEVMEEEEMLTPVEREVIVCGVEQAVNDAATEFSKTFRDIHEKLTNTLAHDLRGPITAAKMSAQLLLKRPHDIEHCIKVGGRITSSMDRLDLMINDLLDASRIRAGEKLSFVFATCDLDVLLKKVVDEINFVNENRIHYQSAGSVTGLWNENGLRRVVENLLINALKFSDPGSSPITLTLKCEGQNTAEIAVHNLGNPISENERALIFQKFSRSRTSEGKSGWGLGLTVVRGVTEAHGGRVELESSPSEGTTFKIVLPMISTEVPLLPGFLKASPVLADPPAFIA
ncbi:MAG: HAMP domain-containing histidine kinase [Bdellovibrionales bacterium]|nr:HAMP domain-containing histidine kinase [Oligoflexia bacterium]